MPVISFNSSPFEVWSTWNSIVSLVQGKLKLSLNFFNVNIGKWEPFLEKFLFECVSNKDHQEQEHQVFLDLPSAVNLNVTDRLIENLNESWKSWQDLQQDYVHYKRAAEKAERQTEQTEAL